AVAKSLAAEDTLIDAARAMDTREDASEADMLRHLMERLRQSPPLLPESDVQATAALPSVPPEKTTRIQESLDFLSPPQQPDELGRLGGYRILEVLGKGGMGLVFRAQDVQLQRSVALKVMRSRLCDNPGARARFLREARAMAAVKSDHVVTIYQVGEDRGM